MFALLMAVLFFCSTGAPAQAVKSRELRAIKSGVLVFNIMIRYACFKVGRGNWDLGRITFDLMKNVMDRPTSLKEVC